MPRVRQKFAFICIYLFKFFFLFLLFYYFYSCGFKAVFLLKIRHAHASAERSGAPICYFGKPLYACWAMLRHVDWEKKQQQPTSLSRSHQYQQHKLKETRTPLPRREAPPPPPLASTTSSPSSSPAAGIMSMSSPLLHEYNVPSLFQETSPDHCSVLNANKRVLNDTQKDCRHCGDDELTWRQEALRKESELNEREEEFNTLVQMQHAAYKERLEEISRKEKYLMEWEQRLRSAEKLMQARNEKKQH
ncbi:hypothetical protein MOQ_004141 [Trypanosoma cruzi marinkellei]|uniref:Uncharacterized protein n=1 Tax=Trypanosoma cruzi marinkellei TaxID=85056 RepID=K2MY52_TRYCR|nr:hypothetical protein MOQ_004141 [Trypanosoma cruzi marinkellei]